MPADNAASETVRAFVAVEVSEAVAQRAAAIIERLRAAGRDDVKWVEPRNFHLTLKFFGDTRRSDLQRLAETLREVAAARAPFRAELRGVGAFPSVRRPEVIWLGIEAGREPLTELAVGTDAACEALGWAREEKPFRAHLTLGRSRPRHSGPRPGGSAARPPAPSAYRADLIRALEAERDTAIGFMPVERLVLVQSQLQPGGPVYTLLESFPLQRREPE